MSSNPKLNSAEENMSERRNLENLFIKMSLETNHHEKSKILYSLAEAYIQSFKNELDTNVKSTEFLQLLSQVPELCEKFLQIVESGSIDVESKSKDLESVSLCFNAILLCLEAFYLSNQYIILIKIALNMLTLGYTHCKESEIIYGELLEHFADQLGAFYKEIEKLQAIVLQYVEKLDMTEYSEDDIQMNSVITEMGNLCQIVFSLDADISFEMWTKYLRIITDHKSLKYISNMSEVSSYLTSKNVEILLDVKCSLETNFEVDDELAAKCFFYLDALSDLMNLVQDCFIEKKFSFVSALLECLILCYSPFFTENSSINIVKNSLKKNTFALLRPLCTDKEFLNSLLNHSHAVQFHLSTILLKLYSLQYIESICLELIENFLKRFFSDISTIHDDYNMKLLYISIPLCTISKTESDILVTLYQLTYDIITGFLKVLPDSLIEKLESSIFSCLVSSSDVSYLLISDIWIYRLRCSTIEFLKKRCYATLQNLHKENINSYKIENLVKRMLRFLPSSDKDTLLETFNSLKFVQESRNMQHRYGIPDCTSTENEMKISSEEQIKMMMCQLNENSSNDVVNLIKKSCTCLELCTFCVTVADCSEILQFLELASELFRTDIYEIQIATLSFLKSLSKKTMPEHNQEFGKIVTLLTVLFSETMHSKNYIVRYEARNVFSYFARCTQHKKVVKETVEKDPTLKRILKCYINAVPENDFLSDKEKVDYLQKQNVLSRNTKFEIPAKCISSLQQLFSRANWRSLI